jgi:hypothetical protein
MPILIELPKVSPPEDEWEWVLCEASSSMDYYEFSKTKAPTSATTFTVSKTSAPTSTSAEEKTDPIVTDLSTNGAAQKISNRWMKFLSFKLA